MKTVFATPSLALSGPLQLVRSLSAARRILPIVFGTAMLLAVLDVAGRPAVFTDTEDYVVNGRAVASALHLAPPAPLKPPPVSHGRPGKVRPDPTLLGARSPAYGFPLWAIANVGTLWLLSAAQAVIGAWLIWLAWRVFAPGAQVLSAYVVQAAVAVFSTLPFFAGFAMPDVFTGYMVLAEAALLLAWQELTRNERRLLFALVAYATMVHGSNPLIGAGTAIIGLGLLWALRTPRRQLLTSGATVSAALYVGLCGAGLVYVGEMAAFQVVPGRPPFLTARLLADGPGRVYLRKACATGSPYAVCRFKDMPLSDSDDFLWDRKRGVFLVYGYDVRRALQKDDLRFALAVAADDPIGVVGAALNNTGEQFSFGWVKEPLRDHHFFLTDPYFSNSTLPPLIRAVGGCGHEQSGCRARLNLVASIVFYEATFFASLLGITALILRRMRYGVEPWSAACGLLIGAVLINAFVCGALSGPFPRYGARMIWLIPMIAAIGATIPTQVRAAPVRGVRFWLRAQVKHEI